MADQEPEMSAPKPSPVVDLLAESHENRLQRLEQEHQTSTATIADVNARLKGMEKQVVDGFTAVKDKIDSCLAPLATRLAEHVEDDRELAQQIHDMSEKHAAYDARLKPFEESARKKQDRWSAIRKGLWTIAVAAIGYGLKDLVGALFK